MRCSSALLLTFSAAALAGCGVLGLGKKRSPYEGVLRFEVEPRLRTGTALRLGIHNDSPREASFAPCARLYLQRFDGLGWTPVPGYRACTSAPVVTLAPGQGTALTLSPVPAGQAYRLVLLAEGERLEDVGRHRLAQATASFDVTR